MLRNTTKKSMRSTDKMRNCHLMDGMATAGLITVCGPNK